MSMEHMLTSPMTVSWFVYNGCFSGSGPLPLTVAYGSGFPSAVRKSTWIVALAPARPPMLPKMLCCDGSRSTRCHGAAFRGMTSGAGGVDVVTVREGGGAKGEM